MDRSRREDLHGHDISYTTDTVSGPQVADTGAASLEMGAAISKEGHKTRPGSVETGPV
jgi:hypothetical protein